MKINKQRTRYYRYPVYHKKQLVGYSSKQQQQKITEHLTTSHAQNKCTDREKETSTTAQESSDSEHVINIVDVEEQEEWSKEYLHHLRSFDEKDYHWYFWNTSSDAFKYSAAIIVPDMKMSIAMLLLAILIFTTTANLPMMFIPYLLNLLRPLLPLEHRDRFPSTVTEFHKHLYNLMEKPRIKKQVGTNGGEYYIYDTREAMRMKHYNSKYLRALLKGIEERAARQKDIEAGWIADYEDGAFCTELRKSGEFLSFHQNRSRQIFFDGISPFKHSEESVTVCYSVDTGLHITERFKIENVIIVGLLSKKNGAPYREFIKACVDEMNLLCDGFEITDKNDNNITCNSIVTSVVVDTKERELILEQKQGGYFSCNSCYKMGESYGGTVCFPGLDVDLRTYVSFRYDAMVANSERDKSINNSTYVRQAFRGMKGSTVLLNLFKFDPTKQCPTDKLHVVDSGVVKYFIELWLGNGPQFVPLESRNTNMPWRLPEHVIQEINLDLMKLRLPHALQRRFKTFDDLSNWKGDDFSNFLLYASVPLLEGRLHTTYLEHWKHLVIAMQILTKKRLHRSEIDEAENHLRIFVGGVPILYLSNYCTIKLHGLLHAPDSVRLFGPLQHFSSIRFEDLNGQLMRKNFGKHKIADHLMERFNYHSIVSMMVGSMRDASDELITNNSKYMDYIESLGFESESDELGNFWSKMGQLDNYSYRSVKESNVDDKTWRIISSNNYSSRANWKQFHHMDMNGTKIVSCLKTVTYTNSSVVLFRDSIHETNALGTVQCFVHCNYNQWYAILSKHAELEFGEFCFKVGIDIYRESMKQHCMVPIMDILDVCVLVEPAFSAYVYATPVRSDNFVNSTISEYRTQSLYSASITKCNLSQLIQCIKLPAYKAIIIWIFVGCDK
jgi:hypothetical protein